MRLMAMIAAAFAALAFPAFAEENAEGYAPMAAFERLDGATLRGEGPGPDGVPIADVVTYRFILGGRALESVHRVEGTSYGGKTVIFYDEGAEEYVFHYFTTAGFHTTGTINLTDDGFEAIETVHNHPQYAEVRSRVTYEGDNLVVASSHVTNEGEVAEAGARTYVPAPGAVVAFDGE